ncbi:MAG: hypothetical protein ACK42D_03085 [Candidatus Paceibacteria bacterium]
MKKLFISILVISVIVLVAYFLLRSDESQMIEPDTYVERDFSSFDRGFAEEPYQDIITLLARNPSPAFERVVSSIYRDSYEVMSCGEEIGGGKALLMTALYDGSIARGGYDKAYQEIRSWDKNAVAEIGHIIFPSLARQTSVIDFVWFEPYVSTNQHIDPRDFYKALFYVGETPYEIHYGWTLNYVIFAPSQACLEGAMMELYHVH